MPGTRFIFAVLWLLTVAQAGQDSTSRPSTRPVIPDVPALVHGTDDSASFIVEGAVLPKDGSEMRFYFATDGTRQLCAFLDVNGVPIILSDGQQTLLYDVSQLRVVRLPSSRGFVQMDWEANTAAPIAFSFGANWKMSDPEKPAEQAKLDALPTSQFRVDRFVNDQAESLQPLENNGGDLAFVREGRDAVQRLETPPGKVKWYRFSSRGGEASLEINARNINEPIPASATAFPDLKQLGEGINLVEAEAIGLQRVVEAVRTGRIFAAKMALAMGPTVQQDLNPVLGNPDWEALKAQDAEFGGRYREALAAQGIRFSRGEAAE